MSTSSSNSDLDKEIQIDEDLYLRLFHKRRRLVEYYDFLQDHIKSFHKKLELDPTTTIRPTLEEMIATNYQYSNKAITLIGIINKGFRLRTLTILELEQIFEEKYYE